MQKPRMTIPLFMGRMWVSLGTIPIAGVTGWLRFLRKTEHEGNHGFTAQPSFSGLRHRRSLECDWGLIINALGRRGFPISHDRRDRGAILFESDTYGIEVDHEGRELSARLYHFLDGYNCEDLDETGPYPLKEVRGFVNRLVQMVSGVTNGR